MGCEDTSKTPRPSTEQPAAEAKAFSGKVLDDIFSRGATEEQLKALRAAAEAHKAAQAQLMEAAGILWNTQVDAAMALGGPHGASVAMARRLSFFDNCTCSPCPIVVTCW